MGGGSDGSMKARVRRKGRRRFWKERRFRIGALGAVLLVLLLASFYQILVLSPRRKKYHYYQDGLTAYERGKYETAEILFRRFLTFEPERAEAHYMLGLSLFRLGRPEEGVTALEETTALEEGFDLAHIALSEYFRKRRNYRAALDRAERAIATGPAPTEAYVALGEVKLVLGDQQGAIDAFTDALIKEPELLEARLKLGDLHYARKMLGLEMLSDEIARSQYSLARDGARKILSGRPGDVRALLLLGKAYAGLEEFPQAIEQLVRVVEQEPGNPEFRLLLARFYGAFSDYEAEVKVLELARDETPSVSISIRLAETLSTRGDRDPSAGIKVLEAAVVDFPEDPRPRIALVDHLRRQERLEDAWVVMKAAVIQFPNAPAVLEARGDLHLAAGEEEEAIRAWRETLAAHPQRLGLRRKLLTYLVPRVVAAVDRGETEPEILHEVLAYLSYFLDPAAGVNPADLLARGWRARIHFAQGEFEEAESLLAAGKGRAEPGSYEGLRLLGTASFLSGDYYAAAGMLVRALAHPGCPKSEADFDLAYRACVRQGRFKSEVAIAEEALGAKAVKEKIEWKLRLANSFFRAGRLDSAIEAANEAKVHLIGKKDVRAHLLASRIQQAKGDVIAARQELEGAVLIRRDAETRGALYAFFAATGNDKLAEEGFRLLAEEYPTSLEAALLTGDYLLGKGDEEGALEKYERARQLDPSSREALYRVVELRIAQASNEEQAIAAAEEAVREISRTAPEDPYLVYFTGKLHLLKGEADQALAALERYRRASPDDPAGLYYLAIAYRRSGDLEKARDSFLGAVGLDPGMVEANLELATLYFTEGIRARWAGDLDEARVAFERVTRYDPNEPETRRLLAETLASLGLMDRAAEEADRVLETRPDDTGALFLSGLFAAKKAEFDSAETKFRRLAELLPENYRGHLYLGMVLAERRQFDAALTSIRQALRLAPDADEVLHALALTELAAGRAPEALRLVEAERERRPDHGFVHHLLGDLYRADGRSREGVAAYRRAFALDGEDDVALALAAALLADEGELDEAVLILKEGVAAAARPSELLTLRARMLLSRGESGAAEVDLRQALTGDPECGPALRELGLLWVGTNRVDEGRQLLEKAVALQIMDPAVFFELGVIAASQGRAVDAEGHFLKVLELIPDDPATLNNLAILLSAKGARRGDALDLARRARKLDPREPRIADTLGWILHLTGSSDDAVPLLIEAAKALGEDPEVLFHAGMATHRAFLWEEARRLLRQALEISPDFPGSDEARRTLESMR